MTYQNAVCRGSWALGTACGKCERCQETRPGAFTAPTRAHQIETLMKDLVEETKLLVQERDKLAYILQAVKVNLEQSIAPPEKLVPEVVRYINEQLAK